MLEIRILDLWVSALVAQASTIEDWGATTFKPAQPDLVIISFNTLEIIIIPSNNDSFHILVGIQVCLNVHDVIEEHYLGDTFLILEG